VNFRTKKIPQVGGGNAMEPIQGVRPFEAVHIETTPLKLVLKTPRGKGPLGTPNLCVAMDAESRTILGVHSSFDPPSGLPVPRSIRRLASLVSREEIFTQEHSKYRAIRL